MNKFCVNCKHCQRMMLAGTGAGRYGCWRNRVKTSYIDTVTGKRIVTSGPVPSCAFQRGTDGMGLVGATVSILNRVTRW